MKRRRLMLIGLVVIAAVIVYVKFGAKAPRSRAVPRPQATAHVTARSVAPAPTPVAPPAATPAAGSRTTVGTGPATAPPSSPGMPPAGGAPPAPGTPPGPGTPAMPGNPTAGAAAPAGTTPQPGAQAPTAVAQTPPDPNSEAVVVGRGERGRADPFAPLATLELRGGAALPPPPGVGLPLPPGFTAPGGVPGVPGTPEPAQGSGMRVAGIMGSRSRVAIIEADGKTYIVGVGERVGSAVVVSILPDKVVMKQDNVTFDLEMGGAS